MTNLSLSIQILNDYKALRDTDGPTDLYSHLAAKYGVTRDAVKLICHGVTYGMDSRTVGEIFKGRTKV